MNRPYRNRMGYRTCAISATLSKTEIVILMQDCGSHVSVHIVDQLLDRHGFHERKALRMRPLARHPDREAQFEAIARVRREALDSADPRS